jgi:peptidoglycan hydrolase-like protein with peptidoglycan-binding domain
MLTPDFQVGRPGGTGHSRPGDVIRLRRALNETGHGSSPPDPSEAYDPSLNRAVKRFQGDYGLEEDGIVLPGGPTERMLNLALAAQRQGGDEGQAQLRDVVGAITDAGLKAEAPPPGDERPIVFADKNGEVATPDQILNVVRPSSDQPVGRRPGEVQVAFAPAIPAAIAGGEAVWAVIEAALGSESAPQELPS